LCFHDRPTGAVASHSIPDQEEAMTQKDLNRAVARATGESVNTILQLGFSLADQNAVDSDSEPYDVEDKILDWDALDSERALLVT
jgi:hypothetical protein